MGPTPSSLPWETSVPSNRTTSPSPGFWGLEQQGSPVGSRLRSIQIQRPGFEFLAFPTQALALLAPRSPSVSSQAACPLGRCYLPGPHPQSKEDTVSCGELVRTEVQTGRACQPPWKARPAPCPPPQLPTGSPPSQREISPPRALRQEYFLSYQHFGIDFLSQRASKSFLPLTSHKAISRRDEERGAVEKGLWREGDCAFFLSDILLGKLSNPSNSSENCAMSTHAPSLQLSSGH